MRDPIGILLAAGLGQRLRPLTWVRPKPLVPLHGIPLLEFGLRQLEAAGCRLVAVNGHHLSGRLERWLAERMAARPGLEIRFFHEPVLLGVGGGLARMARELPAGPLLVQNGDVLHDADLARLLERAGSGGDACLALGGEPRVVECAAGRVHGLRDKERSTHGFTGVHVWGEEARDRLCGWDRPDLVPFLQLEAAAGRLSGVELADSGVGALWEDLGHLRRYLPLHAELWGRPAYRALLERLELRPCWDARRELSLGAGSRLPEDARGCVAWDDVEWTGSAEAGVFLDGARGHGHVRGELVL